jgi:hypothetical protein
VEVNHDGNWWVRQVGAAHAECELQDLGVKVVGGKVTTGNTVEAITWGDLHATILDPVVEQLSQDMLNYLKPKKQFLHDIMEGASTNHHDAKNPHAKYKAFLRGLTSVEAEVKATIEKVRAYERSWSHVVVVDSNHDCWITKWLQEHDYRLDPLNARFFLEAQLATYQGLEASLKSEENPFHMLEWAMRKYECPQDIQFLRTDESYCICNGKIECGMHGHLGPNGARGTPQNLNKVGRRANTGHTHSAGIFNGLYVAGTSTKLKWDYAHGPSSWSHSHVVTYPNGQRCIITMWAGKWRA